MKTRTRRHVLAEGGSDVRFFDGEYGALSTLSPHRFLWNREWWPTAAHAYHAAKFIDGSSEIVAAIQNADSPERAKNIARHEQHRIRKDWVSRQLPLMKDIQKAKFLQHPGVRKVLLDTGCRRLIGGTPGDPFWGLNDDGTGHNYLGEILMELRAEFREGEGGHV
jgi:ribA/ribD-fused uncharacterized protein